MWSLTWHCKSQISGLSGTMPTGGPGSGLPNHHPGDRCGSQLDAPQLPPCSCNTREMIWWAVGDGSTLVPRRLWQRPRLGCSSLAVPYLQSCAIRDVASSGVEAATGLRIDEAVLVPPAPLLRFCAVAVPELGPYPIGSAAAGNVHALAESTHCPVSAVPGPTLGASTIARPDLDWGAIIGAGRGVVDALSTITTNRPGAPVLCLDH
jgi:hypothetical protein